MFTNSPDYPSPIDIYYICKHMLKTCHAAVSLQINMRKSAQFKGLICKQTDFKITMVKDIWMTARKGRVVYFIYRSNVKTVIRTRER